MTKLETLKKRKMEFEIRKETLEKGNDELRSNIAVILKEFPELNGKSTAEIVEAINKIESELEELVSE